MSKELPTIDDILKAVILGDELTTRNKPTQHPTWGNTKLSINEARAHLERLMAAERLYGRADELNALAKSIENIEDSINPDTADYYETHMSSYVEQRRDLQRKDLAQLTHQGQAGGEDEG